MTTATTKLSDAEVSAIVAGTHGDPFGVLGVHDVGGSFVMRAFVPGAAKLTAQTLAGVNLGEIARRTDAGFFEGPVKLTARQPLRLTASNANASWTLIDPYAFGPVLGPLDDYYGAEGTHLRLYDRLGAHVIEHEGVTGTHFALWAPNASRVSVVGDFNIWDGRRHVMRKRMGSGLWEIFVPELSVGTAYKFEIIGAEGNLLPQKADPFAFGAELRPKTASVVTRTDGFTWSDAAYIAIRAAPRCRRWKCTWAPGASGPTAGS
jgi:1,4-alpha-glucan branching enzyme